MNNYSWMKMTRLKTLASAIQETSVSRYNEDLIKGSPLNPTIRDCPRGFSKCPLLIAVSGTAIYVWTLSYFQPRIMAWLLPLNPRLWCEVIIIMPSRDWEPFPGRGGVRVESLQKDLIFGKRSQRSFLNLV